MLTISSMYIPESAINRRVSPCRVTLHFVSSIIDTESKAVHKERRFRQSSEVDLSVGLPPCMSMAKGLWVETTEPSWVC